MEKDYTLTVLAARLGILKKHKNAFFWGSFKT
jgi:hypothetical protein